ncbi:xanthine dehydrogenase accessory protein XdhC [Mesorhizobium sp. KR1-2]|uniref:xanthine dehydrogenase accessory protein XdhC n=1 Tax=Mesorhizobium sp. KR1-2 TaxID=3156609 RepID=UPI0032B557CA
MTRNIERLRSFLDHAPEAALVEVTEAKGSTPRETGAQMLVSPQAIFGTIGGGHLEFMAIDRARQMLAAPRDVGAAHVELDIPLGPEIGQCCGGRVGLSIRPVDAALRNELIAQARAEDAASPHIYVFGGGHVGHALASAFALLPVHATVVDTRPDALDGMPDAVETRLTPVPEEMVREAPADSAFVVLTHDHALDFLIVAEALKRDDAAYVGMIGSKTKKATFKSWFLKTAGGTEEVFARLVSPIGGDAVKDKRPAVIAALAAAEIMTALVGTNGGTAAQSRRPL